MRFHLQTLRIHLNALGIFAMCLTEPHPFWAGLRPMEVQQQKSRGRRKASVYESPGISSRSAQHWSGAELGLGGASPPLHAWL